MKHMISVLYLASCLGCYLDPDIMITIQGSFVQANGDGYSEPVILEKVTCPIDLFLLEDCNNGKEFSRFGLEQDGSFTQFVPLRLAFQESQYLRFILPPSRDGSWMTVLFALPHTDRSATDIKFPPIRVHAWDPTLHDEGENGFRIQYTANPLEGNTEKNKYYNYAEVSTPTRQAWRQYFNAPSPAEFDFDILEEFDPLQVMLVTKYENRYTELHAYVASYYSKQIQIPTSGRKPISRGAPCFYLDNNQEVASWDPCPITDGKLDASVVPSTEFLYIKIPAPAFVKKIVVRGLEVTSKFYFIESSMDGVNWSDVGRSTSENCRPVSSKASTNWMCYLVSTVADGGRDVQYVRLRSSRSTFRSIQEVSLFK